MTGDLKKLLEQSSHYLVGLLGSLAFGFISFPIFTRVFSVADYGLMDFAQKIILLVVACCKCGLQNSALRFYDRSAFAADPQAARKFYSTMFLSMSAPAFAITLLFAIFVSVAPRSLIDARLRGVLAVAAGLIFLRSAQSILWSFLRVEERTKAYNLFNLVLRGATIAVVCLLLPVLGPSITTYFTGTLVVEAVIVGVVLFPLVRRGLVAVGGVDSVMVRASFAFGLPLVIQEIAGIVLDSGDRGVIRHFMGDTALGLYSVAYGLSSYVNTLIMVPLGLAVMPMYMRIWKTQGRERTTVFLSQCLDGFLMAAVLINVLAAVVARDAVTLMASSRYAGADRLIPMLVAGLLIYASQTFLNAGLLIHKQTGKMAAILAYSALLNLALNWLLIPRMGLQAAALATLVSYIFSTVLTARPSFQLLPLRIPARAPLKYAAAGVVAWVLTIPIETGSAFWNLAAKCLVAIAAYTGVLYALDTRVRSWFGSLLSAHTPALVASASE
jgi:O-antigen/teichoic acid export membrane protein